MFWGFINFVISTFILNFLMYHLIFMGIEAVLYFYLILSDSAKTLMVFVDRHFKTLKMGMNQTIRLATILLKKKSYSIQ